MNIQSGTCVICNESEAFCYINGEAMCKECAETYLNSLFDDLTTYEKADALNISYEPILYF